jgi:hypothetical protein
MAPFNLMSRADHFRRRQHKKTAVLASVERGRYARAFQNAAVTARSTFKGILSGYEVDAAVEKIATNYPNFVFNGEVCSPPLSRHTRSARTPSLIIPP